MVSCCLGSAAGVENFSECEMRLRVGWLGLNCALIELNRAICPAFFVEDNREFVKVWCGVRLMLCGFGVFCECVIEKSLYGEDLPEFDVGGCELFLLMRDIFKCFAGAVCFTLCKVDQTDAVLRVFPFPIEFSRGLKSLEGFYVIPLFQVDFTDTVVNWVVVRV